MENGKQIVTITDIKAYLRKENVFGFIIFAFFSCFFLGLAFLVSNLPRKIIMLAFCLLFLFGTGACIYNLFRIRNNTYFKIETDVLVSKREGFYTFLNGHNTHRLCFRCGHYYDIVIYGSEGSPADGIWYGIYDMGAKTVYDTAFTGDSFTLIYANKRVQLAFNNKFFDIQEDL